MKRYFAWFFFVSAVIGLIKMVFTLAVGAPKNVGALELWAGWLMAFAVNSLCFYLWDRWRR